MQRDTMSKGMQNKFESQPTQTVLIVIVVIFRIFDSNFKPDNLNGFGWLHVQSTVSRVNASTNNILGQDCISLKQAPFVPKKSPCCPNKSDKINVL